MITKKTSPKGRSVKVTFDLPAETASAHAAVVGDFNGWNAAKHEMKLDSKRGVWTKSISLKPGHTYEFRYLVDGERWCNDEQADAYVDNQFLSSNSIVEV